ncbi:nickel/cobalt efflux protein RcnA [Vibrio aerogenes CECT 7868]|uniref:Nickel/cobalt efflux system n=1 Tax=Vibrio aerogenes CECT 7868 TaxID=1216006 RepID=A0A1M5UTV5_9VIBR|nr:hypothetical protein [Vibrio aerogenes]SHH66477.1 nickel/cobalt efflux protein RcnA [Vibrio aerogenes CECT 7868]
MPSHQHTEHCKVNHQHPEKPRYLRLNPLYLVLMVMIAAGWIVWSHWPVILMTSIHWQKNIINQLSELIYTARHDPGSVRLLLEISFLYGIFHSLGPGHGKVVVSTYLATHQTKIRIGLVIPVVAALIQALVAIFLVTLFLYIFHTTMHQLNATVQYFFHASASGVILIGIYLVGRSVMTWRRQAHEHDHNHDHHCSCGHQHVVSADAINNASSLKEYLALIFSIGARPCTGALLVLFFAHLANAYWLGVISSILMGAGTALTTTCIAFFTVSGKKFISFYTRDSLADFRHTGLILKILAGIVLVLLGLILLNQGTFGMSPVFGK